MKFQNLITIPLNSCLPFVDLNISQDCMPKVRSYVNSILNDQNIKTVIIGLTWYVDDLIDSNGKKINDYLELPNDLLSVLSGHQGY